MCKIVSVQETIGSEALKIVTVGIQMEEKLNIAHLDVNMVGYDVENDPKQVGRMALTSDVIIWDCRSEQNYRATYNWIKEQNFHRMKRFFLVYH